jgi:hypothetical protein
MGKNIAVTTLSQPKEPESDQAPLIVGDFYAGAYGPTIMLVLMSPAAVGWFQEILRELGSGGPPKTLTCDSRVDVAHLDEIEMTTRSSGPQVALKRRGDSEVAFLWSATREGWLHLAALIQSFRAGEKGHHYLTDDKLDDALIELSFGEHDAQKVARLTKQR